MINLTEQYPQALTIAGSDSDGSAGMQADLHTFFRRHIYGTAVMTAAVAGNSYGIHDSVTLPTSFIDQEFKDLADDYHVRASKTGMLADTELIRTVIKNYQKYDFGPLVVDPVITTKHGNMLLEQSAYQTLRDELIPLATVPRILMTRPSRWFSSRTLCVSISFRCSRQRSTMLSIAFRETARSPLSIFCMMKRSFRLRCRKSTSTQ